jgi:hypothetical protein
MFMSKEQSPPTDWPAAWAALAALDDDDAWDDEADRLDGLWKAEYKAAFVDHALTRPGWTRQNAEVWASEIAADALYAGRDLSPKEVAEADVIQCEIETANA